MTRSNVILGSLKFLGTEEKFISRLIEDNKLLNRHINASTLLRELDDAFRMHMAISREQAQVLAAWVAHTHVYQKFTHTPRLAITSPEKGCGKSTLINLLTLTCHNPMKMDNATESVIFRIIDLAARGENSGTTLMIDEADSFMASREGIRNLLNCGFESSGMVWRSVKAGQDFVPRGFHAFAPVAIAGIGVLPDTVNSRSIPIHLRRKMNGEKIENVKRYRPALLALRSRIEEWAKTVDLTEYSDPKMPDDFGDREADISLPLLAIADLAGDEWPNLIRNALLKLFGSNETESTSGLLLHDVRTIFMQECVNKISSVDVCDRLGKMEEQPWPEFQNGRCITPSQLAKLLKPFGIKPRDIRSDGRAGIKGYVKSDFLDAWERYLPPEAPESEVLN